MLKSTKAVLLRLSKCVLLVSAPETTTRRKSGSRISFDYTDGVKNFVRFFLQGIKDIMFGLGDWYIVGAVLGSIVVSAVGVVYGAVNWNKGGEEE